MIPPLLRDFADDQLVIQAARYSHSFMSQLDASHDWSHILRVGALARHLYASSLLAGEITTATCSLRKILLAALLHDVADRKYVRPGHDAATVVAALLVGFGADAGLAADVQAICHGVSYTGEMADPEALRLLVARHPELAIVQDADRLDAIGAIGVGRVFAYGGARTTRPLGGSLAHFDQKLLHLVPLMKTAKGREIAQERTERLRLFKQWWDQESTIGDAVSD